MCVCVFQRTITCIGFHARWIDGIKFGLFSNHVLLGQTTLHVNEYLYSVLGEVEVRVTICNCLCSCVVECGIMMKGREKVKPGAGS